MVTRFMKTCLLLGLINCIGFVGCGGADSSHQADVDVNRSKGLTNYSSPQTSPKSEKEVKNTEIGVRVKVLNTLVWDGKKELGLGPEERVLIYERTISHTLTTDSLEKEGVNAEVVSDFVTKNAQPPVELHKYFDVYFEYKFVDNNISDFEAKFPKSSFVLGFSRIGFSKDLREALVYVEVNNYKKKEIHGLYYKVDNDNGKMFVKEIGLHKK